MSYRSYRYNPRWWICGGIIIFLFGLFSYLSPAVPEMAQEWFPYEIAIIAIGVVLIISGIVRIYKENHPY